MKLLVILLFIVLGLSLSLNIGLFKVAKKCKELLIINGIDIND